MEKLSKEIEAAAREAKLAYEFNPNSYTYGAMNSLFAVRQILDDITPLIMQRLS